MMMVMVVVVVDLVVLAGIGVNDVVVIEVATVLELTGTVEEAICVVRVDAEPAVLSIVESRVLIEVSVVDVVVVE